MPDLTRRRFLAGISWAGCLIWCFGSVALADDWPTWRCDPDRSAASGESLGEDLHLQWVRDFPPSMLAWPNETRLQFDACYEPIVAGKTLLVGSPNDGSVIAFDTESGTPRWKHFTEGPVRFAPAASKGKIYVGSDDGYLYCLDGRDGRELWKVRGASEDRPDRRHLGNARLISFWPIRGGPVLADGTVYFAAGIWPTLGVFVVAVDAESGRLVWRNDALSRIEKVRIDHNELCPSGLSPQGYLAVEGETLLVPNGRSMPAGLDRKTGKLRYYLQGYRNGDCRVTVEEKYVFVGQAGVVDRATGREVGSRWAAAGRDAPSSFDPSKFHLFEGPIHPYKQFSGCSAWSVLASGTAYDLVGGVFAAYDLGRAAVAEYDWQGFGKTCRPWRWDAPLLWKLPGNEGPKRWPPAALVKAGNRLYGHHAAAVTALDLPRGALGARIGWEHRLEGTPGTMLVADGRLFVVTREGRLACFGPGRVQPREHRLTATPLARASDGWRAEAAEILKQTDVGEGYCLVLGAGSGRLASELLQNSRLKIIVVDRDRAKVNRLRESLVAAGLYGVRAEALVGDPSRFPFPPYIASLIVSEDPAQAGWPSAQAVGRLFDVLRPYGGTLCLTLGADQQEAVRQSAAGAGLVGAEARQVGRFFLLRRAGALAGSAPWTHEACDAARTFFSRDQLARPPLAVLWYGDGSDHGFWKEHDYGTGVKPQVAGGRLFALQIHTSTLHAYDVYTGRLLWKVPAPSFTRYASMEDAVYVAGGGRCAVLEPASGRQRVSFPLEPESGRPWLVSDIRVDGDVILVAVAREKVWVIEKGLWDAEALLALDRTTGKLLWKRQAQDRFNNNAVAMGARTVFCIDSLTPVETARTKPLSEKGHLLPSTILALDARTGAEKWSKTTISRYRAYRQESWLGIQGHDDWLAYCRQSKLVLTGKQQNAWAFESESGKEVWHAAIGGAQPLILRGETFLHQGGTVLQTRTGKPVGTSYLLGPFGCNYFVGSEHLLCLRASSVRYVDTATRQAHDLYAIRSGCSNSLIVADGLLNAPCFSVGCICNYPIQTSFAMFHLPAAAGWSEEKPGR